MMRRLAARLPDARLFGADLSLGQLRAARSRSPELLLVVSDAAALPFRTGAFDVVHWSWLLEHVPPGPASTPSRIQRVRKRACFSRRSVSVASVSPWM
jgi:ubiquinone/menaquinone biosynthesis C-methylase UbiE